MNRSQKDSDAWPLVPGGDCILDLLLEVNPANYALNRKYQAKGLLATAYRQGLKDLRADMRAATTSVTPYAGPAAVEIRFCSECDSDAFLKAVFDALEHSVLKNDKQIVRHSVERCEANVPFIQIRVFAMKPRLDH